MKMLFLSIKCAAQSAVVVALAAGGGAWAQAPAAASTAPAAPSAPDVMIKALATDVLDTIRADRALLEGDLVRLNQLVDQKILPHVNFERMTQLAVGRGWRAATPEQRAALTREFRTLLVRTYAGAVSQVRDHQVQMRPFRAAPSDTDVVVRTNLVPSRGDPIQIDYRIEKTGAHWKIYDVNILGIWLVETYRTSFAGEISRGGIDGLIKLMVERNRSAPAK